MRTRLVPVILAAVVLLSSTARAQWQPDGVPVCTAEDQQNSPVIAGDGAGGAIVAWVDLRNNDYEVYAQRVSALGIAQWDNDGVLLCSASGLRWLLAIAADGAGGAIVTWTDHRAGNGDIYAQRVNGSGSPLWTPNGVALSAAVGSQALPSIVSVAAGGAIVAWHDSRSGSADFNIYAQYVDATGVPQWTSDGVAVCVAAGQQQAAKIDVDGAGGAFIAWSDDRPGQDGMDIFVQRVDAEGNAQWAADGIRVCAASNDQYWSAIVSDHAGGAIVAWTDRRLVGPGIYAQRIDSGGILQWTVDGVELCTGCTSSSIETFANIVSDDAGGAIISWWDEEAGSVGDIYAQRIGALGTTQWMDGGVALCTADGLQSYATMVEDGTGGAIVTWQDERNGAADVYAQRVDADGAPNWSGDGTPVCTAQFSQNMPVLASDGAGGAIVAWTDNRSGGNDIYAQRAADPSNAVAIVSFEAFADGGAVTLRGAFRSDFTVEGVNVYRGVDAEAPLRLVEHVASTASDRFEYVDREVEPGRTYFYRIGVIDADGEFLSPIATVSVSAPARVLLQNVPNPFNPTTTIGFVLSEREQVTLVVYDSNGRRVRTLVDEVRRFGAHDVEWDGRDDAGARVSSGVYFYRMQAGSYRESKKMVLLK